MSTANNRESARFVGTVGPVVAVGVEPFADRIGELEAEERAAVSRGDWPAVRSAVLQKAKLEETQYRAAAGSRRERA